MTASKSSEHYSGRRVRIFSAIVAVVAIVAVMMIAHYTNVGAQDNVTTGGTIERPPSNIGKPGEGHTNVEIFKPNSNAPPQPPSSEFYKRGIENPQPNSGDNKRLGPSQSSGGN